jgi:hypothetical protein
MLNRQPTRRVLTRGIAWSVPVVVVGAPVPAMAASGGTASFTASCGATPSRPFTLSVTGSVATSLNVFFTHLGGGGFSVRAPSTWTLVSQTGNIIAYTVPVVGGTVSGTPIVDFALPQNGLATVSATVESAGGAQINGDTTASVTLRREGNSNNYVCSGAS